MALELMEKIRSAEAEADELIKEARAKADRMIR